MILGNGKSLNLNKRKFTLYINDKRNSTGRFNNTPYTSTSIVFVFFFFCSKSVYILSNPRGWLKLIKNATSLLKTKKKKQNERESDSIF